MRKIGQVFELWERGVNTGEHYMLVRIDTNRQKRYDKVALVSLETGNRWCEPCNVVSAYDIREDIFTVFESSDINAYKFVEVPRQKAFAQILANSFK